MVVPKEKARIYVKDPSKAPPGVPLQTGPRGGMYFDSNSVPKRTGYKPTKSPKPAKGKAPKKEAPAKREIGKPFSGPGDVNLPKNIQQESPEVQASWVKAFNDALASGGSEADALAAAKKVLPDRSGKEPPKPPGPPKRVPGSQFVGGADPNLPRAIQIEAPAIRETWVKTFNATLAKSGSEADAIHAANLTLPVRTNPKAPVRQPKTPKQTEPATRKELTMADEKPAGRAMIALYLNPSIAEMLAVLPSIESAVAGIELEDAEDLHITLAYYPMVQPGERDALIQRAAQIASSFSAPKTEIAGMAKFFASEDDPIPFVLLVDPRGLTGMHESLCYYDSNPPYPAKNHGYIPHITLAYVPRGQQIEFSTPNVPPLMFDAVSVIFDNDDRHDFRFAYGSDTMAYRQRAGIIDESEKVGDPSDRSHQFAVSRLSSEENMTETTTSEELNPSTPSSLTGDTEQAQEKAGRRMRSSWREELSKIMDTLRGLVKWADYDDEDEDEEMAKVIKSFDGHSPSFVVFKDATGDLRWLSFSSNGFEDREREIVATYALEKAVVKADETGERGPLRLFHIRTGSSPYDASLADIGDCDFQAIQGRFLIESGTFRDTELAAKAVDYFQTTEEKLGTSIGFTHPKNSFDGKVYHQITDIVERSVCPHAMVANSWTAFTTLKGEPMDAVKSSWLEKVAGSELARTIIGQADAATKTLEGSVSFKEDTELTGALETVKGRLESASQETKDAYAALLESIVSTTAPAEETKEITEPATTPPVAFDPDAFLARITEIVSPIAADAKEAVALAKATETEVKAIGDRTKSLEDAVEAEKSRLGNEPRGAALFRATAANGNVIDADKAKELTGAGEPEVSPVSGYVSDLLSGKVPVSP